jgi:hypothetical protein
MSIDSDGSKDLQLESEKHSESHNPELQPYKFSIFNQGKSM